MTNEREPSQEMKRENSSRKHAESLYTNYHEESLRRWWLLSGIEKKLRRAPQPVQWGGLIINENELTMLSTAVLPPALT